jgi:hypothetical protein
VSVEGPGTLSDASGPFLRRVSDPSAEGAEGVALSFSRARLDDDSVVVV